MAESSVDQRPPSARPRLRLGIVLAVVCGAIAFLLVQGLGNATTYFRNADEALADREDLGTRRFRLQGTVVDEARRDGDVVVFAVEYHCARVAVRHAGDPPELFRRGVPVVLEGRFEEGSDVFDSDRIMVRHTEEYRTKEGDRLALAEREVCDR
jgi:cytochrome c-type biogenesis protein CcmE